MSVQRVAGGMGRVCPESGELPTGAGRGAARSLSGGLARGGCNITLDYKKLT